MEKFPKIILLENLLRPVTVSENRVHDISSKCNAQDIDELTSHGLFVLSVSSLESMMNDIILYLLQAVPEKMAFKEGKITKEELLSSFTNQSIITRQSEREVIAASYKRVEEFISYFCKVTSIKQGFTQESIDKLKEIRETRNLLLHNNLKINEQYKSKAGPFIREGNNDSSLIVDVSYLKKSIRCILYFINEIEKQLKEKYKNCTKINLLRSIWESFFKTPVMQFDDYWMLDEEKDTVFAIKNSKYEGSLSSGETSLLSLWRSLFTSHTALPNKFNFMTLDSNYQEKALFLLSIVSRGITLY